jgi:hypothetical protein
VPASGLLGSGRFVNYLSTDFLLALAFFGAIVLWALENKKKLFAPRYNDRHIELILIVLVFSQYISLLASIVRTDDINLSYLGSGTTWIKALTIFVLVKLFVHDERRIKIVYWLSIASFLVVTIIAFLEFTRNEFIVNLLNEHYGTEQHVEAAEHLALINQFRLTATFDRNPHGLAIYMVTVVSCMFSVLMASKEMIFWKKTCLLMLIGLGVAIVFLTVSTLGIVALLIALFFVALPHLSASFKRHIKYFFGIFTTAIIAFVILMQIYNFDEIITSLASEHPILRKAYYIVKGLMYIDFSSEYMGSFTNRYMVWKSIMSDVFHTPYGFFFGVGPYRYEQAARYGGIAADSDFMYIFFKTGIIGLICFLVLIIALVKKIQKMLRNCDNKSNSIYSSLLAARGVLFAFIVAGFAGPFITSESFARNSFLFWTLIGIALSTAWNRGENENCNVDS